MSYTKEELSLLSRKELQTLCKQTGVKANKKTLELVDELEKYFWKEENELKELEQEMKQYDAINLNTTWTVEEQTECKESENKENKVNKENIDNNQLLKDTLMKEVERRTEEKLSKIPRFVAEGIPNICVPPPLATPEVGKKRKSYGVKMDSIDKYLAKKKKRAEEQLAFNDKFKEKKFATKKMLTSNLMFQKLPENNKRKSVKIDDEITVNFEPTLKSTPNPVKRFSPRLSSLQEGKRRIPAINSTVSVKGKRPSVANTSSRKSAERKSVERKSVERKSIEPKSIERKAIGRKSIGRKSIGRKSIGQKSIGQMSTEPTSIARKSVGRNSIGRKSVVGRNSIGRKSVGVDVGKVSSLSSPALSKVETPQSKTPLKFDLKASLKKPLAYKPHTGKLKQIYFTQQENVSLPRKPVFKPERAADRKCSVKEMTKNMSTREKRRKDATDKRNNNRIVVLDKRRGIITS